MQVFKNNVIFQHKTGAVTPTLFAQAAGKVRAGKPALVPNGQNLTDNTIPPKNKLL